MKLKVENIALQQEVAQYSAEARSTLFQLEETENIKLISERRMDAEVDAVKEEKIKLEILHCEVQLKCSEVQDELERTRQDLNRRNSVHDDLVKENALLKDKLDSFRKSLKGNENKIEDLLMQRSVSEQLMVELRNECGDVKAQFERSQTDLREVSALLRGTEDELAQQKTTSSQMEEELERNKKLEAEVTKREKLIKKLKKARCGRRL